MENLLLHLINTLITAIITISVVAWIMYRIMSRNAARRLHEAQEESYQRGMLEILHAGLSVKNNEMWELLHVFVVEKKEEHNQKHREWLKQEAKDLAHQAAERAVSKVTKAVQSKTVHQQAAEKETRAYKS